VADRFVPRRSKYRAVPTVLDGIRFSSKKEAARYAELLVLQKQKKIKGLELQPRFKLEVNGVLVGTYVADFAYREGKLRVVEDVKGVRTAVYKLKKKLVWALHGVAVREV
jgi:hypothetical protein